MCLNFPDRISVILEGFYQSISTYIDYERHQDGRVNNQTTRLYRFWDATRFAEYLYDCVAETIRTDLREEIGFLKVFDAAIRATMDIVDMPDRLFFAGMADPAKQLPAVADKTRRVFRT